MNEKYINFEDFISQCDESRVIFGKEGIVQEEWLDYTEKQLGFKLPKSYRWYCKKYEFMHIDTRIVKLIAPPDFRDYADSDIAYSYKANLDINLHGSDKLSVLEEEEGFYYFIVDEGKVDFEYEVYHDDFHSGLLGEKFADNFLEFIMKFITPSASFSLNV